LRNIGEYPGRHFYRPRFYPISDFYDSALSRLREVVRERLRHLAAAINARKSLSVEGARDPANVERVADIVASSEKLQRKLDASNALRIAAVIRV